MYKFKKTEVAVVLGLILAFTLNGFFGFSSICAEIRQNTLRLHVVANSNSEEDQALKLYVRDCILNATGGLFAGAREKEIALLSAEDQLKEITQIAQGAVYAMGYNYTVTANITNQYFATTHYGGTTMPAGRYDALRVEIGTGEGANWWCVLYPPLCIPPAQGGATFTGEEAGVVESGYEIRFAAVEVFERAKELLHRAEK